MHYMDHLCFIRNSSGYGFSWEKVLNMPLDLFLFYCDCYNKHVESINREIESSNPKG